MSKEIDRRAMVRQFFEIAGQEMPAKPCVPAEEVVRFRLRLVAEEFFELLRASVNDSGSGLIDRAESAVASVLIGGAVRVDLPELIDATVDLDYVVEGLRVAFGVNGDPIWAAVHAVNMAKRGGPCVDQKLMKPEGWKPADVEALLRAQG